MKYARNRIKGWDQVEVLTVTDNTVDMLMASTSVAHRVPLRRIILSSSPEDAEHGVSKLVTVHYEGKKRGILFDAGTTDDVLCTTWMFWRVSQRTSMQLY